MANGCLPGRELAFDWKRSARRADVADSCFKRDIGDGLWAGEDGRVSEGLGRDLRPGNS